MTKCIYKIKEVNPEPKSRSNPARFRRKWTHSNPERKQMFSSRYLCNQGDLGDKLMTPGNVFTKGMCRIYFTDVVLLKMHLKMIRNIVPHFEIYIENIFNVIAEFTALCLHDLEFLLPNKLVMPPWSGSVLKSSIHYLVSRLNEYFWDSTLFRWTVRHLVLSNPTHDHDSEDWCFELEKDEHFHWKDLFPMNFY